MTVRTSLLLTTRVTHIRIAIPEDLYNQSNNFIQADLATQYVLATPVLVDVISRHMIISEPVEAEDTSDADDYSDRDWYRAIYNKIKRVHGPNSEFRN